MRLAKKMAKTNSNKRITVHKPGSVVGAKAIIVCIMIIALLMCVGCSKTQQYDVIVIGGEPEGVSAAVTAARNGMKTLLVEDDAALGGLMTLGGLNFIDMCNGRDGTLLTRGTFEEFYNAVSGTAFDIEEAKTVFLQMVEAEPNLTLMLNTDFEKAIVKNHRIAGVKLSQRQQGRFFNEKKLVCKAGTVIDATQDGDVAADAGAPFTVLGEDYGRTDGVTGVTLVFELRGVSWHEVAEYLRNDGNPNTDVTAKAAWGFNEYAHEFQNEFGETRLRGLNLALQNNGNVLVNGFIISNVNPMDSQSRGSALERGQLALQYVLPYLRENYAGFENAELVKTAEQLYVRESRHILGEYVLTLDDILENRCFGDRIAIGSYPVDVPPNSELGIGGIIGNPDRYGVPLACLVPQKVDGLLIVGRSASYTSLAAGSARVIPLGMAEGDAAGVAAAYAKEDGKSLREICNDMQAVKEIQRRIVAGGGYLEGWTAIQEEIEQLPEYETIKQIRNLGLLYGGYHNDYQLEEIMPMDVCQMWTKKLQQAEMLPAEVHLVGARGVSKWDFIHAVEQYRMKNLQYVELPLKVTENIAE